jgi:hypothetical protein
MKRHLQKAAINRRTPKKGHSLVELLAVITGLAVVLGGAIALMRFMLGVNGEVTERTRTVATIGRLAEQFRRDVHQARGKPTVAADHASAEFQLPGGRVVRWRTDNREGLVRAEHSGQSTDRQSSYFLPKGTTAALELQPQGAEPLVVLRIESSDAVGPSLVIEVLAARDERLGVEEEK